MRFRHSGHNMYLCGQSQVTKNGYEMIYTPTTLLLGAGASCHLGYPLGVGLRDSILNLLQSDIAIKRRDKIDCDLESSFFTSLSRGGWSSPDAFLERHPEFLNYGKRLIATSLKQWEKADHLFPPLNNGWYSVLSSSLLGPSLSDFRQNRLSIVTFNYGRSVECFLHNIVMHRYRISSSEAWDVVQATIQIIHVHGALGDYPKVPYETSGDIAQAADGIKIIHEIQDVADGFCSPEFEKANRILEASERIYVAGFAMAEANMRRLRFFTPETVKARTVLCAVGDIYGNALTRFVAGTTRFGIGLPQIMSQSALELFTIQISLE